MSRIFYPYLGKPGAMRVLPGPTDTVAMPSTRGETTHDLASGGVAVSRMLNAKRTYELPFSGLLDAEVALIDGFHRGLFGTGPWRYVDPTTRNVLPLDVSTCGVRANAAHGWAPYTGTAVADTTVTPPEDAPTSGVLKWTGMAAWATLQPGTGPATADPASAPPYLPAEGACVSMWVRLASGTASMRLYLLAANTAGAGVSNVYTTFTATTAWQRVVVAAGAHEAAVSAAAFIVPALSVTGSAPAAAVYMAGAQLEYADTVSGWLPGTKVPQVLVTDGPGRSVEVFGYHDVKLSLAEV